MYECFQFWHWHELQLFMVTCINTYTWHLALVWRVSGSSQVCSSFSIKRTNRPDEEDGLRSSYNIHTYIQTVHTTHKFIQNFQGVCMYVCINALEDVLQPAVPRCVDHSARLVNRTQQTHNRVDDQHHKQAGPVWITEDTQSIPIRMNDNSINKVYTILLPYLYFQFTWIPKCIYISTYTMPVRYSSPWYSYILQVVDHIHLKWLRAIVRLIPACFLY